MMSNYEHMLDNIDFYLTLVEHTGLVELYLFTLCVDCVCDRCEFSVGDDTSNSLCSSFFGIAQDINMCIINDENIIRVIALLNILREKIVVAHTELGKIEVSS
jgi:hypothetical protein